MKKSVDATLKIQSLYHRFASRQMEQKAMLAKRSIQDNTDTCWTKFQGSFIGSSLRETRGGCSWIIYLDEVKDPSSIERDPRQEIDVEDSDCPGLQEKTVDGLYDNRKTMLGGPYIISSKTSEEQNATLLLLLIRNYYSLPPS